MNQELKEYLDPGKKNILFIYALFLMSLIIPTFCLVAGVFAYVNQSHEDDFLKSHYRFAFRNFIIIALLVATTNILVVLGWLIGIQSFVALFNMLAQLLVFILLVVRSILAMRYLVEDVDHPNPLTYTF